MNDKDERSRRRTDEGDDLAEARHFFLQGRLTALIRLDLARDQPELGIVAHVRDDHFTRAARDETARIEHIYPLRNGYVFRFEYRVRVLFHGHALARERGFVAQKGFAFQKPAVRGDLVARFHIDDIAGDDLLLWNVLYHAAAHYFDLDALFDLVEFRERLGAAAFHDHGQNDGHGDRKDDADDLEKIARSGVLHFAHDVHRHGDDPGEDEQDEHGLGRRLEDAAEKRFGLGTGKFVRAVSFGVALYLFGRKPRPGV